MRGYFLVLTKQFFRSWNSLVIMLFPLALLLGLGSLLPAAWIVPSSITIALTTTIMFTFGANIFELRKTNLIKSMSLTRLNKFSIFSTNILFTILVSLVSWGTILGLSYLLTEVYPFLVSDFSVFDPDLAWLSAEIDWANVEWGTMFYSGLVIIILSFSLIFFFVSFIKTTQSLYLITTLYIFALILIGGVVIPTFFALANDSFMQYVNYLIPHYYANNLMISGFATSGVTGETAAEIIDTLVELTEYLDTPEYQSDIAALSAWLESGSPVQQVGIFQRWEIDWSQVNGYETGYTFQNNIIAALFEGPLSSGILDPGESGESLATSTLVPLLQTLDPNNSESLIKILDGWFVTSNSWDWQDWQSTLDVFVPWSIIIASTSVGVYKFKWSIR